MNPTVELTKGCLTSMEKEGDPDLISGKYCHRCYRSGRKLKVMFGPGLENGAKLCRPCSKAIKQIAKETIK
jgi:hypothetical protein